MIARAVVAVLLLLCSLGAHAAQVNVGSKNFTEAVILGEIATAAGKRDGVDVQHRAQLGGTRILWRALETGQIDAYAEYTGTLAQELLQLPKASHAELRAELDARGLAMTQSLGFQNTYAFGMRRERAQALGITTLSELARHPGLKIGLSNEFMQRADGWPGVRAAYALPQTATGLDHDLAYRALHSGAIEVTDLYSTDAEIAYYTLQVLRDDRHYFPEYQAVFLYRKDLAQRAPQMLETLQGLQGRIDEAAMQHLNAQVKLERKPESAVAAQWLGVKPVSDTASRTSRLWRYTHEHLALVGSSLGLALLIALPLGVLAARRPRLGQLVLSLTGVLQTLPSLAVFVFMIPLFGIGAKPAIAALLLYSLLPIVRNTHAGLTSIPRELHQSAEAIGLPAWTRLWRIELPLARRTIVAGIQTAAVINVGTATLGALIGAGGYGQPILTGIRLDDIGLILEGAVPAALLALLVQAVFGGLERWVTPRGLRIRQPS
ncbi:MULTISPECIES: glycine betaine ABC transporter substrate-binding protein [Xanthomonas]|uniref:ABC transporter permease subunit n=1 Tax=Xanthomonas cucurbitae TaxID=56453 RepID=A0A2S7DXG3_9XANT|nr:glycine betaine ABC transporter substrate-binding protein [Xanthomonas cucurbitae]PPU78516.1 amino acid ABC transporter permease [Xanthomonas cucurbitae]QHG88783.1 ABC transporter permease subunit [Xanthomonas cucurbitae]WDM67659.1 ABC transporter permease subunit [Xanthomonas cucurbitae]WDM71535.1 ABC transporter permease subunit [Xanthomonas cucurbitae]WDM75380.1 ABC transporter permease subunit [Xanthomonas cucurbitae]